MSNNIPFDIQMEIIKCLHVKPLIRFRLVSKSWMSFIESSQFIKGYGARHTLTHSRILSYGVIYHSHEVKFTCLLDDDIETFKVQQPELVVSPFLKDYSVYRVVGACHGLLCLDCFRKGCCKRMVVIWNPSIEKSFGIALPNSNYDGRIKSVYGFGVCPVTSDPTVVKVLCTVKKPWHVEVFTLSSGVWNVIPSGYLPRQSIKLNWPSVVIDRFIYWGACEETFTGDGESTTKNNMVVSFNLITKEFKVIDLPDSLTNEWFLRVSLSKLRGSLVVSGDIHAEGAYCCGVWVMEHDLSFRKLFNIGARVSKILGFSKSGEIIFESQEGIMLTTLSVYDPSSQQIKNLGISGVKRSFFMGSYKKSLHLLNQLELHTHYDDN